MAAPICPAGSSRQGVAVDPAPMSAMDPGSRSGSDYPPRAFPREAVFRCGADIERTSEYRKVHAIPPSRIPLGSRPGRIGPRSNGGTNHTHHHVGVQRLSSKPKRHPGSRLAARVRSGRSGPLLPARRHITAGRWEHPAPTSATGSGSRSGSDDPWRAFPREAVFRRGADIGRTSGLSQGPCHPRRVNSIGFAGIAAGSEWRTGRIDQPRPSPRGWPGQRWPVQMPSKSTVER